MNFRNIYLILSIWLAGMGLANASPLANHAPPAKDDAAWLIQQIELSDDEASATQGGIPWPVFTALVGVTAGSGKYLADVYIWRKKAFNAWEFAREGGCGGLAGLVTGSAGGWAGRIMWRSALVTLGAAGVVSTCNGWL